MKIFGYVRDENGNFDNRKEKVLEFAKQMNFAIDEMICEKSSENYEDMAEIRKLLESEKDFILLVSDTSDIFEDDYAKVKILKKIEESNVFLIDVYYPNFDCCAIFEKNAKDFPFASLQNMIMIALEAYLRKKYDNSDDNAIYGDMRTRLSDWESNLK